MTFFWFCVSYFIYVFNQCYIDEFIQYIQFLLIYLIVINCFFSPSFSFCYHGTLKRVYETSNVSKNVFFKHFVLGNNLIFNIIRLTFLASESLKLIQKTFHLKDMLFHQFLIPTKRYLWKKFSPFCSQDSYEPHHFLEQCWHQQIFLPCLR